MISNKKSYANRNSSTLTSINKTAKKNINNNFTEPLINNNHNNQSRIPIYNGNNLFLYQNFKTFNHTISDLRIMDLPEHVRIHQDIHNRKKHSQR